MSLWAVQNALRKGGIGALSALALLEADRRFHSNTNQDATEKPTNLPENNNETPRMTLFHPKVAQSSPAAAAVYSGPEDSPFWERRQQETKKTRRLGGSSRLARHRTVRMMKDTSTRFSLASRYAVDWDHPLGEGAFGAVYAATDKATGEPVALKKITKEYTDDKGFQREMNALHHVRQAGGHPYICGLRENFDERGFYYLALDLVSGGEMFDHLVELGAYSEADAARLVREVASALAFLHGIGIVHGDLKPENLMLSTQQASDAAIKLVDFGTSQVKADDSHYMSDPTNIGNTTAYCPPEVLALEEPAMMDPSLDMWALGVILYIMLTGMHPFDLSGQTPDDEIAERILAHEPPPLRDSPVTAHLSESAISLIEKLMTWDSKERLTALEMLEHPWVRGETANQDKMANSDKKLSMFRVFKSRLEAKVFENIVSWSDNANQDEVSKKTSLIERSFHSLDPQRKGFLTTRDLRQLATDPSSDDEGATDSTSMSLSNFEDLLSDHMRNKYFPKGHVVYYEGDTGNHMYFINSGTIEVFTKDGIRSKRTQGDFFGEGALLHPEKIRSASIKCVTPVHAIEVSREYFEKYLSSSAAGVKMTLREKDKTRRRNRAKTMLRLQNNMKPLEVTKGTHLYKVGEEGKNLYILEDGVVDVKVEDHTVFNLREPGNVCGEHSLITGRPRNSSAVCVSDVCKMQVMRGRDFNDLIHSSASLKESIRDICLRREFLKALVFKTKKPFPEDPRDLKEAFEAADEDSSGKISLDNVRTVLLRYDPTIPEEDLVDIITSLDLDQSGVVSFEEFTRIFGNGDSHPSTKVL